MPNQRLALFEKTLVRHGLNQGAQGLLARCYGKNCNFIESVYVSGGDYERLEQMAKRKLEALGWKIGSIKQHARCPACITRAAQMRAYHAKKQEKEKMGSHHGPLPPQHVSGVANAVNGAAAPEHKMSLTDRRIIFAKLEETYGEENKGYKPGWSDQNVATDLGVPQAWVVKVRKENFGELGSNPDIESAVQAAEAWVAEAAKLSAQCNTLKEHFRTFATAASTLTNKGEMIEKKLHDLKLLVKR